jgi:hypothetical protein
MTMGVGRPSAAEDDVGVEDGKEDGAGPLAHAATATASAAMVERRMVRVMARGSRDRDTGPLRAAQRAAVERDPLARSPM